MTAVLNTCPCLPTHLAAHNRPASGQDILKGILKQLFNLRQNQNHNQETKQYAGLNSQGIFKILESYCCGGEGEGKSVLPRLPH